eukprot:scaffold75_cov165-Amphora_coffeaeformis.AAC.11
MNNKRSKAAIDQVSSLLAKLSPSDRDALCTDLEFLLERWEATNKRCRTTSHNDDQGNVDGDGHSLLSLSPDIMKHILSNLPVKDLIRLRGVSTRFLRSVARTTFSGPAADVENALTVASYRQNFKDDGGV